jgi:hypothetical protein
MGCSAISILPLQMKGNKKSGPWRFPRAAGYLRKNYLTHVLPGEDRGLAKAVVVPTDCRVQSAECRFKNCCHVCVAQDRKWLRITSRIRNLHSAICNGNAPGTPKRHQTSLSAATGEVLTRFARQRPSDLGHVKPNRFPGPGSRGRKSRQGRKGRKGRKGQKSRMIGFRPSDYSDTSDSSSWAK